MSIKICKINYFSVSFKLNEKKKVSWGIQETFGWRGGGFDLYKSIGNISKKKGSLRRMSWRK